MKISQICVFHLYYFYRIVILPHSTAWRERTFSLPRDGIAMIMIQHLQEPGTKEINGSDINGTVQGDCLLLLFITQMHHRRHRHRHSHSLAHNFLWLQRYFAPFISISSLHKKTWKWRCNKIPFNFPAFLCFIFLSLRWWKKDVKMSEKFAFEGRMMIWKVQFSHHIKMYSKWGAILCFRFSLLEQWSHFRFIVLEKYYKEVRDQWHCS